MGAHDDQEARRKERVRVELLWFEMPRRGPATVNAVSPPDMHVAITGASAGIGEAIAKRFALAGASLSLVARREERLRALAAELDAECSIHPHDLAEVERATAWLEPAVEQLGPIDVLVNNAGIQVVGPTAQIDVEQGERSLRVNVLSPLRLTRAVLPSMLARGSGCIVDIASMASLAPTPCMFYYNASKGALAAASEALRGELRHSGVHVVTVYPGIIPATDMGQRGLAAYGPGRLLALQPTGTAEALADHIHRAVTRRHDRVIYPRLNTFARWFPGPTRWLMDRFTPPLR